MKFVDLNGSRSFVNLNGALAFVKRAIKPAGYRILVDGKLFCSSKSEDLAVIDPVVTMEANKAGSCEFTIPPTHPMYSDIEIRKSVIEVFVKGRSVFRGFPIDIVTDFYKQKTVTCEGELSVFNDSVIRPTVWPSQSAYNLLTAILTAHNGQVDATKQMTVGTVTITGNIAYNSGYSTTMEVLKDLVDKHGGYVRVRRTAGVSYLDWLEASPNNNDQIIKIGKNLIDLSQTMTAADVVTRCVPLGAKLGTYTVPDVEDRLTINSVNSGLDYLDAAAAQAEYGIVTKVVEFDNITVASHLKTKGQNWLASEQFAGLVIEATAFDLNLADDQFEEFKLLDTVHVVSAPHGLNRTFVISKMTLNLNAPEKNTIQLGKEVVRSLTAKTADASTEIQRVSEASVSPNAVKGIIESAHGGTIYTHYDANGVADELYILDGATIATSTRWWRFNVNGWAYTPDAGQTYSIAADMTGKLTANDVEATIGHIAGWDIGGTEIHKEGTYDISGWDSTLGAFITAYLTGRISEEDAIAAGADLDGSGHVDYLDLALYIGKVLGYYTNTSGTYKASTNVISPLSPYRVSVGNSVTFEAGVHGMYGECALIKNVVAGGLNSAGNFGYVLEPGHLKLFDRDGSITEQFSIGVGSVNAGFMYQKSDGTFKSKTLDEVLKDTVGYNDQNGVTNMRLQVYKSGSTNTLQAIVYQNGTTHAINLGSWTT